MNKTENRFGVCPGKLIKHLIATVREGRSRQNTGSLCSAALRNGGEQGVFRYTQPVLPIPCSTTGTLRGSADECGNGNIHGEIVSDGGYADQGTWTFDVYGERVSSQRTYSLIHYQH